MSNEKRDSMLDEANELGLDFPSNVKTEKLNIMIHEAKGEPVPVDEITPPSPKVKKEKEKETKVEEKNTDLSPYAIKRKLIAERKGKAFKTQVVTITNKDNRENDVMTTVYLSFENQYFGLSKIVPLDIPVELEVSLISIAEKTIMTLHKDEIIDGKRTGNKVPVRVKKFAISYGKTIE